MNPQNWELPELNAREAQAVRPPDPGEKKRAMLDCRERDQLAASGDRVAEEAEETVGARTTKVDASTVAARGSRAGGGSRECKAGSGNQRRNVPVRRPLVVRLGVSGFVLRMDHGGTPNSRLGSLLEVKILWGLPVLEQLMRFMIQNHLCKRTRTYR